MSVTVSELPNGLRVATDTMNTVETVSLGMWVDVGARHERAGENGVSHLLEHMAFKGTERRSAADIAGEIEAVGGYVNAYTTRENTAYFAKVLRDDAPLAVDVLADILTASVFDERELAREREVILQEIGEARDNPEDCIFDAFQGTAFPDQPMGRDILGHPDTIRTLPRDRVVGYMHEHYRAPAMVLAAAGRIGHGTLLDLAERYFGGLPALGPVRPEPARFVGGERRERRDLEQTHIVLGCEGPEFRADEYYPAQVLSVLYGGGMSSRLFQEVREKRGLAYAIYSFVSSAADTGLIGVYAGVSKENTDEVIRVVRGELESLAAGPGAEELSRAKAQLRAGLLMMRENTSARSEQLARQLIVHGRPLAPEELAASVDAVGAEDVAAVAGRMVAAPSCLAVLGP